MMEDDKAEAVAAAVEDFLEQKRQGRAVSIEAFAATHPDITAELTSLLPVMMDVEDAGDSAAAPPPAEADFPESLGDFRLLERIGSGGMGAVFRASQESLHREVAIKLLHPTWNGDARRCEAFENESRLIAGLRHTNIVEVYGAGHENGFRYYVMGLVQGSGVSPKLLKQVFPALPYERAVATVGLQAAQALAFAHEHGVLHRDVKPGNILLDTAGVVHVSDFGLATVLNEGEDAVLVSQCHDGTLRYMAPERLAKGENNFAGDQYGLGLTLYELLTRRPAFADCPPGTLIRHICETPVSPLKEEGELGAIINKSISFEPGMRYASVQEMADDLQRYMEGRPVRARAASSLRRYALWCRRNRQLAWWSHAAAGMLLLFLASLAVGYVQARRSLARENAQHLLAVKNARVADETLQSIYSSMLERGDEDTPFSRADAELMEKLLPYCEELAAQTSESDTRVAMACRALGVVALRLDDFSEAEQYYRRALALLPQDSVDYVRTLRGLCRAVNRQGRRAPARKEVAELVTKTAERLETAADFTLRLELVQLLTETPFPHLGGRGGHAPQQNNSLLQAAGMLNTLLQEQPQNATARLAAVRLLAAVPQHRQVRDLLGAGDKSPMQLAEKLLEEEPDNADYKQLYLHLFMRRLAMPQQAGQNDAAALARACTYATALLAENPHDMGRLMSYITLRRLYTAQLQAAGKTAEAQREQERTQGAVALSMEGMDMKPDDRQRFMAWLNRAPRPAEAGETAEAQQYRKRISDEQRRRWRQIYGHDRRPGSPPPPNGATGDKR